MASGRFTLFPQKKPDIAALREKQDFQKLIGALNHPDFDVQWQAAEALGKMGSPATEHLIAALQHPSREVRLGIIEALGEIKDYRAVPALLHLLKDVSVEVRWATAIALGEIGDLKAINPLLLSLLDPDKYVRYGAAIALNKLGWEPRSISEKVYYYVDMQEWDSIIALGPSASDFLLPFLNDGDPEVRSKILEILGLIGGEKAKKFCQMSLSDSDMEVRWNAVLSGLKCGISHLQLPLGVSKRPRKKNPYLAGFLNFIYPPVGSWYAEDWGWWKAGVIYETYILCLLLIFLFINNGEFPILPDYFIVFYVLYGWMDISSWMTGANEIIYAFHIAVTVYVFRRTVTKPDVL
jgi:hypothetical protein